MSTLTRAKTLLLSEAPRPRSVVAMARAPWLAVGAVCFGAFMGQLDASIVTLTFPAIRSEFGTTLAAVQWVSLGYLLTVVALLVPVGRLADRFGRKQLYLYGFALFTVASAACGLTSSLPALVAFRAVQGIGAAMLQANSVALVTTSVPPRRRRAALGVQAAAQALGLAIGPVLGGVFVASVGWRWVFLVNVPIGVLGLIAGYLLLPRTRERCAATRLNPAGPVLLALGSGAVLLGLSSVSGLGLAGWLTVGVLCSGFGGLAGFWLLQRRGSAPLIPPDLLGSPRMLLGLAGALCGYLVLFGPLVLVPLLLSGTYGAGITGVVSTALPAGFALAAVAGGRLVPRGWSGRARCVTGALVCVLALGLLAGFAASPTMIAAALFVLGVGIGLFTPANNAQVMAAIPASSAGLGGGMVNMARGFGTALGVCVVTLVAHLAPQNLLGPIGFCVLGVAALVLVFTSARAR